MLFLLFVLLASSFQPSHADLYPEPEALVSTETTSLVLIPDEQLASLKAFFETADINNDTVIDLAEFRPLFDFGTAVADDSFNHFDTNNDSFIVEQELYTTYLNLGVDPSLNQNRTAIQLIDTRFDAQIASTTASLLQNNNNNVQCTDNQDFIFEGACKPCPAGYIGTTDRTRCIPSDGRRIAPLFQLPGVFLSKVEAKLSWDTTSADPTCDCININDCQDKGWCYTLLCGTFEANPLSLFGDDQRIPFTTYATCKPNTPPVPKIAESCFVQRDWYQVFPPLDLQLPKCWTDVLKTVENPATGLFDPPDGVELRWVPGFTVDGLWNPIERVRKNLLEATGVFKEGENFFSVPYNGVGGIPGTSQFNKWATEFKAKIEEVYATNNDTPVNIVGYSLGGNMGSFFLRTMGQEWVSKHIHKFIPQSSPMAGAGAAVFPLFQNSDSVFDEGLGLNFVTSLLGIAQDTAIEGGSGIDLWSKFMDVLIELSPTAWTLFPTIRAFDVYQNKINPSYDITPLLDISGDLLESGIDFTPSGYGGLRETFDYFNQLPFWESHVSKLLDHPITRDFMERRFDVTLEEWLGTNIHVIAQDILDVQSYQMSNTPLYAKATASGQSVLVNEGGDGTVPLSSELAFNFNKDGTDSGIPYTLLRGPWATHNHLMIQILPENIALHVGLSIIETSWQPFDVSTPTPTTLPTTLPDPQVNPANNGVNVVGSGTNSNSASTNAPSTPSESEDSDSDSNTGMIVGITMTALIVVGGLGGFAYWKWRASKEEGSFGEGQSKGISGMGSIHQLAF